MLAFNVAAASFSLDGVHSLCVQGSMGWSAVMCLTLFSFLLCLTCCNGLLEKVGIYMYFVAHHIYIYIFFYKRKILEGFVISPPLRLGHGLRLFKHLMGTYEIAYQRSHNEGSEDRTHISLGLEQIPYYLCQFSLVVVHI